jgi:hypothetical protein
MIERSLIPTVMVAGQQGFDSLQAFGPKIPDVVSSGMDKAELRKRQGMGLIYSFTVTCFVAYGVRSAFPFLLWLATSAIGLYMYEQELAKLG